MLKINSQNNIPFFLLFVLIIFISISIPVEAGTPKVSVSASFSSQVNPGDTPQLDVSVSEIGGQDWIKNANVEISVSPSNGIYLSKTTSNTVTRINKLSSAHFVFPIQILDNAPSGDKTIHITVQYYEMDILNIETYGPYFVTLSKTFYVNEQYGTIAIASNPSGANVYLDGVYKGTAPLNINNVIIGSHTIKLTKSGYNDVSSTVTVNSGRTASVSKTLSALPIPAAPVPKPAAPVPEPVAPEEEDASLIIVGAVFLLLIFGIVGMIIKKSKNSSKNTIPPIPSTIVKPIEEKQSNTPIIEKQETKSLNTIEVKSAFSYKSATILYKIKVENPTLEPIGDIKVNLYVPDVFLVSESTKSIAMLKPSESKTATFEIRPTGECGDCEVSGKVVYYDYSTKKTSEIEIPAKNLSIVCPMIHSKEISEDTWRNALSGFAKAEESTKEIDMPASTLFNITTDILQDMNLYMLEPKISDSSNLYRAVAKFYGEGVKSLKYAAQIEVVGGAKKSKLILKAWAEREDALTGFYHGILDEIEKRVHVKGYIDDSIVQNFYHNGDNIGTQVKDSFVYKSNVGNVDADTCPQCGKEKTEGEPFCSGCGAKV